LAKEKYERIRDNYAQHSDRTRKNEDSPSQFGKHGSRIMGIVLVMPQW
jgi:hypothetical protein